jgi:dTDP-4-dehydrorhamnose 3,5-epimerase
MGSMKFNTTRLDGLYTVDTTPIVDTRGIFVRTFCEDEFVSLRDNLHWKQSNLSTTRGKGSIRGMHFQFPPAAEVKLIRCLRGRVLDVAVDVRQGSPTFLHWEAVELTEDNDRMMFIPEGFAHGFQTLTDEVQLLYMHSSSWSPAHEGRLRFDDPRVDIAWPLPVSHVSDRDLGTPLVDDRFTGVDL